MENSSAHPADFSLLPQPYAPADVQRCIQQWNHVAQQHSDKLFAEWMSEASSDSGDAQPLLKAIFGNSPYLSRLLLLYPHLLHDFIVNGADKTYRAVLDSLSDTPGDDYNNLMSALRIAKGRLALLVALADISAVWTLEQVTGALSEFAEKCLQRSLDTILHIAAKRGEIVLPHIDSPSKDSGIIVLGMGKLGGRELNYSSDIDLIIFYEAEKLKYKGRLSEQHFMNKLCHDLVTIMQERTAQGYVFRTDLRLRPDPASTPPAVTTHAAYYYYESVGQNWERAAMIKARPVAGDIEAGAQFLKTIVPFIWRRNLDFAAINDIHSIKRQMDSVNDKEIQLKGHNIKLGLGGIREIEFYVQIHQLIWGGREPSLRTHATCETLAQLAELGLVDANKEALLHEAYVYFRKVEHRLQMIGDEQTHTLPESDDGIAHIACFMGYQSTAAFEKECCSYLRQVHEIYASSFKGSKESGARELGDEGNLVFTGVSHDPETLQTLRNMGYSKPETISEIIMGWHHGSKRATRTKRARELLTEMMPHLIKRLSETSNPDAAFLKFDEFLTNLPGGVQLFSLFTINPHLLGLIADIMGSAPTLADALSKSPELLEAALYDDFYETLPPAPYLAQQLDGRLSIFHDFENGMEGLRYFRNEKQFQAGVHMLKRMVTAQQAGEFLSNLADVLIQKTYDIVMDEFSKTYGHIKGSRFAVLALGKLGSREMTFSSDIDLVFIYDVADFDTMSDGEKSFSPSVYFNRFAQRFLHALSTVGRGGKLYEVDTRLRPSGKEGLMAVSTKALVHYFDELAWTFEYMAFTKARVILAEESHREELDAFIHTQLTKPRDKKKLRADVAAMRERIMAKHNTKNPWDIKYVYGGLIDIDFIAQYLLLLHAPETPGARAGSAADIFDWLEHSGRMEPTLAQQLKVSDLFLGQVFNMLRLCCDRKFIESSAPAGLKKLLVESVKEKDFASLTSHLIQVEQSVHEHYIAILNVSLPACGGG